VKPSELGLPPLAGDLERVEALLAESVGPDDGGLVHDLLSDAAGHLLTAGGKRLRPTLTLCAAYAAYGGDLPVADDAVTGAAAVELVHLGSLYHDDVIDEAETRRGVPSVNARWSNIVAILAGDYLLARASELAASLGADVAGLLARTIGELCRGQVLELQHLFDVDRTEESYFSSVEGKTASLMATACRIGGMVSELDDDTLDSLTAFGHHLGMCFQIVDDVLDVTRSDEELGKPAGNDLREGVYTLPVIHALKESSDLRTMLGRSVEWDDVARARDLVASNGAVDHSLALAREHAARAADALTAASGLDVAVTTRLAGLVADLVDRSS
jgi:heptaprenyl diphosphate synthase